jgi:DNA topoisomerase-2
MTDPEYGIPWDQTMGSLEKDDQSADHFGSLSEHWRIFLRSHIYASSSHRVPRALPVFNVETGKMMSQIVTTPKALERSYLEILSNATSDNTTKSRDQNIDPGLCTILMSDDTISIENEGAPFPILPHPELTSPDGRSFGTVAQLVFSKPGSGSNLKGQYSRKTSGQNGIGSKYTNIHSRIFTVEIGDNRRGVHQRLEWRRNMVDLVDATCTPPYVFHNGQWVLMGEPYRGKNFVRITWKQDFRKFACVGYSNEEYALYMRYAIDASYSNKIVLNFNGIKLDYRNIEKYAALFAPESVKKMIKFYTFDTPPQCDKKDIPHYIETGQLVPQVEGFILDKPGEGFHNSYCNGIVNVNGGVHTNEGYRCTLSLIKNLLITDKSYHLSEEDVKKIDIKILKKHAILVINFRCRNMEVEGQDKHTLMSPTPTIVISPDDVKNLKGWGVLTAIYDVINAKKKSGKKKKKIINESFRDANFVGKPGVVTILLPCEGVSAGGYGDNFVIGKEGSTDIYAIFSMQGKLDNVSGMDNIQMDKPYSNGKENVFVRFMEAMGLIDGIDYCTPEGIESLRYKYIMVLVDADSDGTHILCLLINFLYRRFPSFIKAGRLMWILTPIIRAVDKGGRTIERFYNICDYEQWAIDNPRIKHDADHFKGLGRATEENAQEDAKYSPNVIVYFDDEAEVYLQIAFDKIAGKSSAKRKQWIMFYREYIKNNIIEGNIVKISKLLNVKLVEYSLDTLPRGLISYMDNFKLSQRQVIAYMAETSKFGTSDSRPASLDVIAGAIKAKFKYHHGDIYPVIAKLGINYPGSNNLGLVTKDGMMGTRFKLGKDCAAARYVSTKANWCLKFLIKKELYDLIPKSIVEGEPVEPKWIPTLLPLGIINGTRGISTGWSCYMTSHHPGDVCEWVLNYITGNNVFPMMPWFMGFTGNVTLEVKTSVHNREKSEFIFSDEEKKKTYSGLTLKTEGIYNITNIREKEVVEEIEDPDIAGKKKKIKIITTVCDLEIFEVPIGVNANDLHIHLSSTSEDAAYKPKKIITPYFKYTGYCGSTNPVDIGMVSRDGLSNISTVDINGTPVTFQNIYQLMASFCDNMSNLFAELKLKQIIQLTDEVIKLAMKVSLIAASIRKQLIFINRDDTELQAEIENIPIILDYVYSDRIKDILAKSKIPFAVFESIGAKQFTVKNFAMLVNKLREKENELIVLESTNHLEKWRQWLIEFLNEINSRPEYQKLPIHQYEKIFYPVADLISGKVVSPFIKPLEQIII